MNLITSPLRKAASVAATASIVATSFVTVVAPAVSPAVTSAATTCVHETGSTTVYPALVQAQPALQGGPAFNAWPTGTTLGCDVSLIASGSGSGKAKLMDFYTGVSGAAVYDIAASSAPLSGSPNTSANNAGEIETNLLMAFQVGGDAMVIVVRDDNPVNQITMAEVTGIYNGDISNWQALSGANGKTGAIVPRARIAGSGTRDDMNRLFKMNRGTVDSSGHFVNCKDNNSSTATTWSHCEPNVIDATGLNRFTTSQEEGDAICASPDQIAYTSLANLQKYGPGTTACNQVAGGSGHTIKALQLQSSTYPSTGATGAQFDATTLTSSGSFVSPSVTTAAVGGSYPAKRQLLIALPKVATMAAKWGTGNGTGWTDQESLSKAMDLINYMGSTQGQQAVAAVGFIAISVPSKPLIPDADIDLNGGIGLTDIGQITGRWNMTSTDFGAMRADVDNNGGVGLTDIGKITGQWGATGFVAP